MMIIMGVNLRDKFLVGDYSKKLLKGISFLGLFLFLVVNGYGQVTATIGISDLALSSGETATVTITFSGVAVGFDNTDLTLPGGTLTPVNSTDGNITFTAIYTPPVGVESATNVITLDNTGVTDTIGTAGTGTTDSPNFSIDTAAPSGYSVLINQDPINAGNETAVSFTFTGAEVGATYNYTFSSTGGGG
ncbi:MAG: Ig-like domain-containing protein, partial [Eudoraea sp.]|uniref:Ig-like domain-containing protein n=1 Tax=Eudoraea sp. TaxID=1979955 RepID=UPI003C77E433